MLFLKECSLQNQLNWMIILSTAYRLSQKTQLAETSLDKLAPLADVLDSIHLLKECSSDWLRLLGARACSCCQSSWGEERVCQALLSNFNNNCNLLKIYLNKLVRKHLRTLQLMTRYATKANLWSFCVFGQAASHLCTQLLCWWECRLVEPLWKAKKLKMGLPFNTATSLLGIYLKESKTLIWKNISTAILISALFTIAKIWKHPKYPSVDEWIEQLWEMYTMDYYSAMKKKKILSFATVWMNHIMLSERNQSEKDKYYTISLS